jgi:D-serine deaminase-like pyridoxal phosphate-dependent protein
MDSAYAAIGVPFESAIACVARCVSRRDGSAAVLDAGLKAMSTDHGFPRPLATGMRVLGLSDEHTRLGLSPGADPRIGQVVLLEPSHLDPTVNLHDALFVWDAADGRMARWPVDGRRTTGSP